jgi:hypothetical protein
MNFDVLNRLFYLTGFRPKILFRSIKGIYPFVRDLNAYRRMSRGSGFQIRMKNVFPILADRGDSAGLAEGHYFHQDLWAAKKIFRRSPVQHVDIGSRVDGFVAHLLVFMPVTAIDIRSLESSISGLSFVQDDATELGRIESNSIESLSTLHAAEHFGLGRYSDPIDPLACFKFMSSLQRVLSPGGRLYFSVPIGRERVEFNAHRIFAPKTILDAFAGLQLISFSFIGDDGRLYEDIDPLTIPESNMACGLFEFTKPDVSGR